MAVWWMSEAPAHAAVVGVNSDATWGISEAEMQAELRLIWYSGVRWIRASVALSQVERNGPGRLNLNYLRQIDTAVALARASGINVLLELEQTPYWASADPAKHVDASGSQWRAYWTYRHARDYARIVSKLVRRYAPMGVHAYELWNEPNNPSFWPSGVNAAAYARLLKAAYPAVKAADHTATVVMGGLMGKGSYGYLAALYRAGAKRFYDAADFHIYPSGDPLTCSRTSGRPSSASFCLLDGLRAEMLAHHDHAPVWVTELGWSTCADPGCVTQEQQAAYLTSAFALLHRPAYRWVKAAFVYQIRDLYWDTSDLDWGSSLGVLYRDFTPKPAYAALMSVAHQQQASLSGAGP
jgi:hypothetical protein